MRFQKGRSGPQGTCQSVLQGLAVCGEGTFWQPAAAVALFLTRSRRDVNIGWIGLDSISSRILAG